MKTKILICGGSGFIGQNLVNFFKRKKKYTIWATYNKKKPKLKNVNWIKINLCNPKAVDRIIKGKDIVIQAAATTSGAKQIINRPYIHVTDNAIMNSYIMKSCSDNKIKHVIFFSCTVMYPNTRNKLSENFKINYNNIDRKYFGVAQTKLYIEKICKFFSMIGKTKFTCIRHSNVYGPFDKFDLDKSHFFGATITKVLTSKNNSILNVWGKGNEYRNMLYIDDLLSFVYLVLKKQKSSFEIYNCGSDNAFKVKDIILKIIKISKKKLKIYYDKSKPTININILIDSKKAKKQIGWKPKISLEKGISKTLSWYRKNFLNELL